MKHVVAYSSGKDSTALTLLMKERYPASELIFIFDDTIWEHPWTYEYLDARLLDLLAVEGARFHRLVSAQYPGGMEQLVQLKGRVPSPKARFCTEELKVKPTIEFLKTINDDYELHDGKRAQESQARSKLPEREWSDAYDCYVSHDILYWTHEQVFQMAERYGIPVNPLYKKGAGRVGCFPCVLINHRELKAYLSDPVLGPFLKERVYLLEKICGRSFFPPNYIPKRFQTGFDPKSGKAFCWSDDVFKYIEATNQDQLPMGEPKSCMSIYNLCER
jgi:3'-phosphoadenosine 5'-phosphosulfate sulfotransferase (PAPS reductase)/FAD synthetase